MVIMITSLIYSFFLPLKLSEVWFYTGLIIYLLALIVSLIALQNFATAQKDKPITKGIYSFSRNPMYLSGFIAYIGISIASASWIFLLSGIVYIILQHVLANSEERFCLKNMKTHIKNIRIEHQDGLDYTNQIKMIKMNNNKEESGERNAVSLSVGSNPIP